MLQIDLLTQKWACNMTFIDQKGPQAQTGQKPIQTWRPLLSI